MRRIIITVAALVVGLGLVAAGCGSDDQGARPIRTGGVPTAPDRVIVRIDTRGGFTSAQYQLSLVPQLTIFGDGRVILTGPVTEQYPPHALPNLLTGTLDRAAVERLVQRATELDLLQPQDFGQPAVSDLPTTDVTLDIATCDAGPGADCATPRPLRAYALDFEIGRESPGVTAAHHDARRRLGTFVREASDAAAQVATEPYRPAEVAVYAGPTTPGDASTGDVEPGELDWPLGDLATLGPPSGVGDLFSCAVLAGPDAAAALTAGADASAITRWRSGGGVYTVVFRPLMPDEHACP